MTAVSQLESLRTLLRKQGLGAALPPADGQGGYPPVPTGFAALDTLLGGGLPRGQITELTGRESSGRTSLAFSLLATGTARREVAAYIDACDCFDPCSAQKAGVWLDRLLWVRCGSSASGSISKAAGTYRAVSAGAPQEGRSSGFGEFSEQLRFPKTSRKAGADRAWQALNLVAAAGGFGVIVLDLGGLSRGRLRAWQGRQWLRVRRAIEHTPTALVILAAEHLASSVSALVLEFSRAKTHWSGQEGVSLLLRGLSSEVRIAHQRRLREWRRTEADGEAECRLEMGS